MECGSVGTQMFLPHQGCCYCLFSDISEPVLSLSLSANNWTEIFLRCLKSVSLPVFAKGLCMCSWGMTSTSSRVYNFILAFTFFLQSLKISWMWTELGSSQVFLEHAHCPGYVHSCTDVCSILHSQEYAVEFQCPLQTSHSSQSFFF